jgi:hypothetical protein
MVGVDDAREMSSDATATAERNVAETAARFVISL